MHRALLYLIAYTGVYVHTVKRVRLASCNIYLKVKAPPGTKCYVRFCKFLVLLLIKRHSFERPSWPASDASLYRFCASPPNNARESFISWHLHASFVLNLFFIRWTIAPSPETHCVLHNWCNIVRIARIYHCPARLFGRFPDSIIDDADLFVQRLLSCVKWEGDQSVALFSPVGSIYFCDLSRRQVSFSTWFRKYIAHISLTIYLPS